MKTTEDKKIKELDEFIEECLTKEYSQSYLIAILHKAQELYGYLEREVMDSISYKIGIPSAHIWGVATFYHYFNLKPQGKHVIHICLGTACYVKGADDILNAIKKELSIDIGETTEDGMFTLHGTRCLGACGLAPVIMIDEKIYGELDAKKAIEVLNRYKKEV